MKPRLVFLSLAVGVAVVSAPAGVLAKARTLPLTITSKLSLAGGTPQANDVLAWIRAHSPEYAPILKSGTLKVTRSGTILAGGVTTAASVGDGPPTSMPTHGAPGDEYTVSYRDAQGNTETWGYRYQSSANAGGGGWVLVEYHYKSTTSGNEDVPNTLGG